MNPMVSTRKHGIDKFTRGERVLCYEPDRTKARVLYESKVRQFVVVDSYLKLAEAVVNALQFVICV